MRKRTIQEWAAISEIISGAAVVASLLLVAYTINESTEALAASTWDAQLQRSSEINALIASTPDLAGLLLRAERGSAEVSEDEFSRFTYVSRMRFGAWEALFVHYLNDQMSHANWKVWHDYYLDLLDKPGYREAWATIGIAYDPRFQRVLSQDYIGAE